ncbi:expressed unknown protein [Seminavis robusta]|uniref:DUF6824 domain-containing protein n=1 Tax=Seminavis robusta TaxID=568900 RepID=A0A9N8D7W4_9STRA|nr:expressed unknown protein [Seminavis robusta]|eukprot:Sro33_g021320.1 n/a (166) ;mRNA; r:48156-48653
MNHEKVAPNDVQTRDVLLGRGGYIYTHSGNVLLRKFLDEQYMGTWIALTVKMAKTNLTRQIVMDLETEGFRFLKWDRPSHEWLVVDQNVVREKIATLLREMARFEPHSLLAHDGAQNRMSDRGNDNGNDNGNQAERDHQADDDDQAERDHQADHADTARSRIASV